jgi:hypothetical protein
MPRKRQFEKAVSENTQVTLCAEVSACDISPMFYFVQYSQPFLAADLGGTAQYADHRMKEEEGDKFTRHPPSPCFPFHPF